MLVAMVDITTTGKNQRLLRLNGCVGRKENLARENYYLIAGHIS